MTSLNIIFTDWYPHQEMRSSGDGKMAPSVLQAQEPELHTQNPRLGKQSQVSGLVQRLDR